MDQSEGFMEGFGGGEEDDGFGPPRASELSANPRVRKARRQLVEFVTPRRRQSTARASRSQSAAAPVTQEIPEGGGFESVENVLILPIEATADTIMVEGDEEMKALVDDLQFKAKPEHLKQIRPRLAKRYEKSIAM